MNQGAPSSNSSSSSSDPKEKQLYALEFVICEIVSVPLPQARDGRSAYRNVWLMTLAL